MNVSEYMSRKVQTARPDDGLRATFWRMRDLGIRHFPVTDADGRLVGIVSDRDLRRPDWVEEAPDISHLYRLDDHMTVEDVMTRNVETANTYDDVRKAARVLMQHRFGALPVLDKAGDLVGMLSAYDLLAVLEESLADR